MKSTRIQKALNAAIAFSLALSSSVSYSETQKTDAKNPKQIISKLEDLRSSIDLALNKSVVSIREEDFNLNGSLSGTIHGTNREYSPLSMAVLGAAVGLIPGAALAGLPTLIGAAGGSLIAGAGTGALAGAIGAPFIPTGTGTLDGSISGAIHGKGYHIFESPSVFGLVTLDPKVVAEYKAFRKANPNTEVDSCSNEYFKYLSELEKNSQQILSYDEAQNLIANLNEYQEQIRQLRIAKKDSFDNSAMAKKLDTYLNDYEKWINSIRINLTDVTAYKPVIDLAQKTLVRVNHPIYTDKAKMICSEWLDCDTEPVPGYHLARLMFVRPAKYTEQDYKQEFANNLIDRILEVALASRSQSNETPTITKLNRAAAMITQVDSNSQKALTFSIDESVAKAGQFKPYISCDQPAQFAADTSKAYEFFAARASNSKIQHVNFVK